MFMIRAFTTRPQVGYSTSSSSFPRRVRYALSIFKIDWFIVVCIHGYGVLNNCGALPRNIMITVEYLHLLIKSALSVPLIENGKGTG